MFKVGDRVECISMNFDHCSAITVNKVYEVLELRGHSDKMYISHDNNGEDEEGLLILKGELDCFKLAKDEEPELSTQENGNTIGGGQRFNTGKPNVGLLVPESMEEEAAVWTFGAKKYSPNGWKGGLAIVGICASILRHTFAIMRGEDVDPESGCLHSGHISCNASMLSYFKKTGRFPELDDRYKGEE